MKVNVAFNLEIKVPESGGRVKRHRIHVAWSPVWSFHSQWWFGLPSHLLVLVHLCFLKSTVNAAIYQDILEHFMLPSADKLYGDADFIFQQDLAPAHTAKGTKSWHNDHGVTVLDWPANSPNLNPIENIYFVFPVIVCIHGSLNVAPQCSTHTAPDHDTPTTILDCRQDTLVFLLLIWLPPHTLDTIWTK